MKKHLPSTNLRFDVAEGMDHGFDLDPALFKPYKEAAMGFMVKGWLG